MDFKVFMHPTNLQADICVESGTRPLCCAVTSSQRLALAGNIILIVSWICVPLTSVACRSSESWCYNETSALTGGTIVRRWPTICYSIWMSFYIDLPDSHII